MDGYESYSVAFYEAATYAASIGGAIVAMKDYSVDAVLSYSYGTWLYHRGSFKKHLKLFANRGALLSEDKNVFSMVASFEIEREEQESLSGDEIFSTIINQQELENCVYANQVTYEDDWLIIGEKGDADRKKAEEAIDLRVVGGGDDSQVRFFYQGHRVALFCDNNQSLWFEEGFVVDKKGSAKPFFRNLERRNNTEIQIRMLDTYQVLNVNARDVEFVLFMGEIPVPINT